ARLVFDGLPPEGGLAELRLDITDDLQSDNAAYCFVPAARRLRVGVATDDTFLLRVVGVDTEIDARRIEKADAAVLNAFDCLVVSGSASSDALRSDRPMLLINPPDVTAMCRSIGRLERPEPAIVLRSHPVNTYLSYADVHVEASTKRETAPWLRPIVST